MENKYDLIITLTSFEEITQETYEEIIDEEKTNDEIFKVVEKEYEKTFNKQFERFFEYVKENSEKFPKGFQAKIEEKIKSKQIYGNVYEFNFEHYELNSADNMRTVLETQSDLYFMDMTREDIDYIVNSNVFEDFYNVYDVKTKEEVANECDNNEFFDLSVKQPKLSLMEDISNSQTTAEEIHEDLAEFAKKDLIKEIDSGLDKVEEDKILAKNKNKP